MPFSIEFLQNDSYSPFPKRKGEWGNIIIDEFSEKFFSVTDFWSKEDYKSHWKIALTYFLSGSEEAMLTTNVNNPAFDTSIDCWHLQKKGDSVCIQNLLLFIGKDLMIEDLDKIHLSTMKPEDEENDLVSVWELRVEEVEDFLDSINASD